MEFNCPTCQTKLRVADEQRNSKVRCRACGTIFRPLESSGSSRPPIDSPGSSAAPLGNPFSGPASPSRPSSPSTTSFEAAPKPERDRFSAPDSSAPPTPRPVITPRAEPRTSSRGSKGGWGIIFFIILMLLSRGPRLLRNFNRQPAPPPIQIDHDEVMRRLREQMEETELDENGDLPQLPAAVNPNDFNLDGNEETP